jgi:hypothetical protein
VETTASGGGAGARWLRVTLGVATGCALWLAGTGCVSQLGQELTVDARTGRLCDTHFVTSPIMTDPASVRLFST